MFLGFREDWMRIPEKTGDKREAKAELRLPDNSHASRFRSPTAPSARASRTALRASACRCPCRARRRCASWRAQRAGTPSPPQAQGFALTPCDLYGEPLPMEEDGGFAPYELKSYLAVRKES